MVVGSVGKGDGDGSDQRGKGGERGRKAEIRRRAIYDRRVDHEGRMPRLGNTKGEGGAEPNESAWQS